MKQKKYLLYFFIMVILTIALILIKKYLTKDEYSNELISKSDFYFDTVVTIQIYDCKENYNSDVQEREDIEELIDNAMALCKRYETIFSKTNPDSELYKINNGENQNVRISKELYDVLSKSIEYSQLSQGKFDVTISKLSDQWNFKNKKIPSDYLINSLLVDVNYENILLSEINDNYYLSVKGASTIDLGGIAKGYVADKIKFYLTKHGIKSGIINLGGNIVVIGDKPDSSPYNIGINKPFSVSGETICTVNIEDKSIVTSGIYERMFEENGKIYHHIIDPDTGYPADTDVYSATIICNNSATADALSTVCVLLGTEKALDLINSIDDVDCIIITNEYEVKTSFNLKKHQNIIKIR